MVREAGLELAVPHAIEDYLNKSRHNVVRFTYECFRAKYGFGIFGSTQPKRALDAVADVLYSRGFSLKTGIQVKHDGLKGNGFAISSLEKGT